VVITQSPWSTNDPGNCQPPDAAIRLINHHRKNRAHDSIGVVAHDRLGAFHAPDSALGRRPGGLLGNGFGHFRPLRDGFAQREDRRQNVRPECHEHEHCPFRVSALPFEPRLSPVSRQVHRRPGGNCAATRSYAVVTSLASHLPFGLRMVIVTKNGRPVYGFPSESLNIGARPAATAFVNAGADPIRFASRFMPEPARVKAVGLRRLESEGPSRWGFV
jgi:hypothetical protein